MFSVELRPCSQCSSFLEIMSTPATRFSQNDWVEGDSGRRHASPVMRSSLCCVSVFMLGAILSLGLSSSLGTSLGKQLLRSRVFGGEFALRRVWCDCDPSPGFAPNLMPRFPHATASRDGGCGGPTSCADEISPCQHRPVTSAEQCFTSSAP